MASLGGLLGLLACGVAHGELVLPALAAGRSGLLRRGAAFGLREVADPEGDRALRAAQFELDLVVGEALEAQLAGSVAEVVLGVGAVRPGGWGLALQEAVQDVVVVHAQAVADLAAAEALAAEGEGLLAQALEVGVFAHGLRFVRNMGFRSWSVDESAVRAITCRSPEFRSHVCWGRCVRWTA